MIAKIQSLKDAKEIWKAVEAGKDRGHMEAKLGKAGIPNSKSGYPEQLESEARFVLYGNAFIEQPYKKMKSIYPTLSVEKYNEKKKAAEIKFAHLYDLREERKKELM